MSDRAGRKTRRFSKTNVFLAKFIFREAVLILYYIIDHDKKLVG